MTQHFYSNGKLLLTGEYVVLDGALSFALPTKYGQALTIKELDSPVILWTSLDEKGEIWFHTSLQLEFFRNPEVEIPNEVENLFTSTDKVSKMLLKILLEAKRLNPNFLNGKMGYEVHTTLSFPRDWGLGSSSTLISNIAQWANVDPYALLSETFNGSGYDIACAQHNRPIIYQIKRGERFIKEIEFIPPFKDDLFFVHLNRKQNSREGITRYKKQEFDKETLINKISELTEECICCTEITRFKELMNIHELLLADILNLTPVKEKLFPDFEGSIKSLGAWGGDFVLAIGDKNTPEYFINKGYKTVIPFAKMIL
ncbi:GYDIA family GHMP kinase [uncultured Eudoraea sp.]|uniref:GYDIA family GHMP kinase n=1 Tax=uncultured Eudoraea sp. TaxID=1035614 RepID=UPI00262A3F18|nr:GYDIA family GHMP kinase [uncultured Eudoraea sp.]